MTNKELYAMKLHEIAYPEMDNSIHGSYSILRVPGGWIYSQLEFDNKNGDNYVNPVFIPFDNEFM